MAPNVYGSAQLRIGPMPENIGDAVGIALRTDIQHTGATVNNRPICASQVKLPLMVPSAFAARTALSVIYQKHEARLHDMNLVFQEPLIGYRRIFYGIRVCGICDNC